MAICTLSPLTSTSASPVLGRTVAHSVCGLLDNNRNQLHVAHSMRWLKSASVNRTLILVRRGANVVAAAVAAVQPSTSEHPWILFFREWGWLLVLSSLTLGTWGCTWLLRIWGDPKLLAVLDDVLDQFRDGVFEDVRGDHAHHRVTLFQHRRCLLGFSMWPCSGWLVPVARSGHTSQKTKTRFRAPDDPQKTEGIAGRAWASINKTAFAANLPDLESVSSREAIAEWANLTNVSEKWVRKRNTHARSLMGFRVEKPNGKPWGVLVIDSRNPSLDKTRATTEFRNHGKVLSRIVEGL